MAWRCLIRDEPKFDPLAVQWWNDYVADVPKGTPGSIHIASEAFAHDEAESRRHGKDGGYSAASWQELGI